MSALANETLQSIGYEVEQLAKDLMQELPRGGTARDEEDYQLRLRQRIRGARLLQLSSALLSLDAGDDDEAAEAVYGGQEVAA